MYQNLAILAAFAFIYSAFAKRIERNWISGPIVWSIVIYSLLSLTLVRMLPILLLARENDFRTNCSLVGLVREALPVSCSP